MKPETALYMTVLEVPCLEVVHVHKEFEDSVGNVIHSACVKSETIEI